MIQTTNYALKKIELNDSPPDITVINPNWDIIDTKLKENTDELAAKAKNTPVTTTVNGLMTHTDKIKLNGVAEGANNYTHPTNHPPSIITQDASNRFVTDAEKTAWNGSFIDRGALPANANWNNYVSNGAYRAAETTNHTNHPSLGDWLLLDVVQSGGYVKQIASEITTGRTKERTRTDAGLAWTGWEAPAKQQEIYSQNGFGVTTGTATALVLALNPAPTSLYRGLTIKVKLHVVTGTNPTLNVNGLGARSLYKDDNTRFSGKGGQVYTFVYDGSNFYLSSGGGGDLNVFRQASQPNIFDGVWIKDSVTTMSGVVIEQDVVAANSFSADTTTIQSPDLAQQSYSAVLNGAGHIFYMTTTYRYNESNNTWTKLADKPSGGYRPIGVVNNLAYAIGGSSANNVEVYNPATNTWSILAGGRIDEAFIKPVVVGTDIYLVGGESSGTKWNRLRRYNTLDNTITNLSGFFQGYNLFAAGYYNGKIRAFFSNDGYYDYDIATNTRSPKTAFNFGSGSFSITYFRQIGNYVYYTGSNDSVLSRVDLANMSLVTYPLPLSNAYPHGLIPIPSGLMTGGNSWGGGGNSNRGCMRFVITEKTYAANSVIIVRNSDYLGIYYTEFTTPSKRPSGNFSFMKTGFDDVIFYGNSIDKYKETYYGNGTSWVRLK